MEDLLPSLGGDFVEFDLARKDYIEPFGFFSFSKKNSLLRKRFGKGDRPDLLQIFLLQPGKERTASEEVD